MAEQKFNTCYQRSDTDYETKRREKCNPFDETKIVK